MGRTGIAPRPDRVGAAHLLAVAVASLALLLCGAVDVLPRSAAGPLAATSAAAAPAPGAARAAGPEVPGSSLGARAAGLAAVPVPTGPGGGLPPTAVPLVAPHLVAAPQQRPPTSPPAATAVGALGSRAPPGPAGT